MISRKVHRFVIKSREDFDTNEKNCNRKTLKIIPEFPQFLPFTTTYELNGFKSSLKMPHMTSDFPFNSSMISHKSRKEIPFK